MRMDCFAWSGKQREEDGIRWIENEKCIATINKSCEGCNFYKRWDTVTKHEYYIYQTKITEWIPK